MGEGQAPLPSAGHIRLGVMLGTGPGFPLGAEPTTAHGLAGRGALDGAAGLRELRPAGRSARSAPHAKPLRGPVKPKGPQGKPNAGRTGLRFPAALPGLTKRDPEGGHTGSPGGASFRDHEKPRSADSLCSGPMGDFRQISCLPVLASDAVLRRISTSYRAFIYAGKDRENGIARPAGPAQADVAAPHGPADSPLRQKPRLRRFDPRTTASVRVPLTRVKNCGSPRRAGDQIIRCA